MWHAIETAPKDGKFYLFDSEHWDHPMVLRWGKIRDMPAHAFVSDYGRTPRYLPQVWRRMPARWRAAEDSVAETNVDAMQRRIDELEEFLRGVATNAIAVAGERK